MSTDNDLCRLSQGLSAAMQISYFDERPQSNAPLDEILDDNRQSLPDLLWGVLQYSTVLLPCYRLVKLLCD